MCEQYATTTEFLHPTSEWVWKVPSDLCLSSKKIRLTASWCPRFLLKSVTWAVNKFFRPEVQVLETSWRTQTVDLNNAKDAIGRMEELMARIYGKRVKAVLMGPEQLRGLYNDQRVRSFDLHEGMTGQKGRRSVNIQIISVPWLNGIVPLPEGIEIQVRD